MVVVIQPMSRLRELFYYTSELSILNYLMTIGEPKRRRQRVKETPRENAEGDSWESEWKQFFTAYSNVPSSIERCCVGDNERASRRRINDCPQRCFPNGSAINRKQPVSVKHDSRRGIKTRMPARRKILIMIENALALVTSRSLFVLQNDLIRYGVKTQPCSFVCYQPVHSWVTFSVPHKGIPRPWRRKLGNAALRAS